MCVGLRYFLFPLLALALTCVACTYKGRTRVPTLANLNPLRLNTMFSSSHSWVPPFLPSQQPRLAPHNSPFHAPQHTGLPPCSCCALQPVTTLSLSAAFVLEYYQVECRQLTSNGAGKPANSSDLGGAHVKRKKCTGAELAKQ